MSIPFWGPESDENYKALKTAASEGDEQLLEKAVKAGVRLDALFGHESSDDGQTALHLAAGHGHANIVRLLLEHGMDVNIMDRDMHEPSTPIHSAAHAASATSVAVLLNAGAQTDGFGPPNDDSVLSSVLVHPRHDNQARIDTLSVLLDHGVDINIAQEDGGVTAMNRAVGTNNQEVVRFLIGRGASLDGSLAIAARLTDLALVRLLIEAGAEDPEFRAVTRAAITGQIDILNILLAKRSHTDVASACNDPVSGAAKNGNTEALQVLLDHGFKINKADRDGLTPLHQAVRGTFRDSSMVQFLLDRGADPTALSVKIPGTPFCAGMSILHIAAERCCIPIIHKIITIAPSLIHSKCGGGECCADTPLLTFARSLIVGGPPQVVEGDNLPIRVQALAILIDAGANVQDQDHRGRTVLHIVAANRLTDRTHIREKAIQLLLQKGADILTRDNDGKVPFDLADQDNEEIAGMLRPSS